MLIKQAGIAASASIADVRVQNGRIAAIGNLTPLAGEHVVEAVGGALLPGLHDHHIHLTALAAQRTSVLCGPPAVTDAPALRQALATAPGTGWIRGIGYHESVMGLPDCRQLDAISPDRPLRIQHRSGRMWLLNSQALSLLLERHAPPAGMERDAGRFTGRLFDADDWLRAALASTPPDLSDVAHEMARVGVTGVTDMTPRNDASMADWFDSQFDCGAWPLRLHLAGTIALGKSAPRHHRTGPAKLHLHEAQLPDFDQAAAFVGAAHKQDRGIAIHCVTEVELVFALALFEQAGVHVRDRIEHASIVSDDLLERMAALDLIVCVQPHFIAERGDHYLADVEPRHHAELYRLSSLRRRGIALCGGSDAPFGGIDPWRAMRAAVDRRTPSGALMRSDEALTPEDALNLFLADPHDERMIRTVAPGQPADLCLLSRPWQQARERLSAADVRFTMIGGEMVHEAVDQPPIEGLPRT